MPNIGDVAKTVNSRRYNVFIGSTSNELINLQNARMGINHSEDPEDTTSGGVVYFSSNDRYFLEGTLLYSEGLYGNSNNTGGLDADNLLLRVNGEVPTNTWVVKLTGKDGSSDTFTFSGKLETFVPYMTVPGGTKVDIRIVITSSITET